MIEEAQRYFRDERIKTVIQEGIQHERCPLHAPLARKISFRLLGPQPNILPNFGIEYLSSSDPPSVQSLEEIPIGFSVLIDFPSEGGNGWSYAESFEALEWTFECQPTSCVRKRKVQRLLVGTSDLFRAEKLKATWRSKFFSIHPGLIASALQGFEYKIEMVVEYQRFFRDRYDSYNLTYSDPANWNYALPSPAIPESSQNLEGYQTVFDETPTSDYLKRFDFVDPTSCPSSYLRPLDQCTSFKLIDGWQILHDFIHILHPNKDQNGWQYSEDFSNDCDTFVSSNCSLKESKWVAEPGDERVRPARRRLWMKTLVRETDLDECRTLLDRYIQSHLRGVIFSSRLQRRSSYRKRWCEASATLRDTEIEIEIENNYQRRVTYSLQGNEPVVLSHLSGPRNADLVNKFFLFGLRRIGGAIFPGTPVENHLDTSGGIFCILNAPSAEIRDCWVSALTHQLLLVNTFRYLRHSCPEWSPVLGPPCLVDVPYISGRLWKRGDMVWKLRTFELRKSGVLAYFKRGRLIGEVHLLNDCSVRSHPENSFQFPFSIIASDGTIVLQLAASDDETRKKWITALRWSISAALQRKISISDSVALGLQKDEAGVFWYEGEVDLETESTSALSQEASMRSKRAESDPESLPDQTDTWMLMMVGLQSNKIRYSSEVDFVEDSRDEEETSTKMNHEEYYSHWTSWDSDVDEPGEKPSVH